MGLVPSEWVNCWTNSWLNGISALTNGRDAGLVPWLMEFVPWWMGEMFN